jgi:hypothetical protein
VTLTKQISSGNSIESNITIIVDDMWNYLSVNNYVSDWTLAIQELCKRDCSYLLQQIKEVLTTASETPISNFSKYLFTDDGISVLTSSQMISVIKSYERMEYYINNGIFDTSHFRNS